ncbi:ribonuclease H-like domain-containing protein [Tanacetum coccineum]
MTITNLTTLVPVKLDTDEMNYSSWMCFFKNLCKGHELLKHILGEPSDVATSSDPSPPIVKWLKIDLIVLSWIFTTLSKTLQQRLVVEDPQTAKQAWDLIAKIFNDNMRTRSIALKAELRSLKLGDLSIDAYFRKPESISTILTSLGSPINNDDVVTIALEGLPDKYDNVSGIIVHREPFPDLKMVHSMLTTEEIRLKSQAQATSIDSTSTSPMVLLANSGNSTRRSNVASDKVNKPCFHFNKGFCRFGEHCKFLHNGVHGNHSLWSNSAPSSNVASSPNMTPNDMMALIQTQHALLAKLGYNGTTNIGKSHGPSTVLNSNGNTTPVALHMSLNGPLPSFSMFNSPPGFLSPQQTQHFCYQPTQLVSPAQSVGQLGQSSQVGQTGSRDPTSGNWNMDTSASSHLNDFVSSLSDIFNLCIYPFVLVGDGYSIPVTNSGHSILSTPHRPFHLNNVLTSPNILKNLIYVCKFVRNNHCIVEFDAFGFSIKDFITRRVLLCCDSTGDLYSVTKPSTIPHAFLTSQDRWHQCLGHPGSEVLRHLLSNGTLSRYKARLVVNGSTQLEGVDVDETFSPVVKLGTISFLVWLLLEIGRFINLMLRMPSYMGTHTAYLLLYVDDIVLTASSETMLQQVIASLHQEFSMTDLGSLNYFLSISVTCDSSGMFLSQRKYAIEILERAHMVNCNPSRNPVDTESKLGDDGDLVSDLTLYQSLAGFLQYLTFTHPYISYAVQHVCLYMHDPQGIISRLLNRFCDADWASFPTIQISTLEYHGVTDVVSETCWLRNLLRELHTPLTSAMLVYCDNVSAIYLSSNPIHHQRTKHIEIDIHFVRDLVIAGQVRVLMFHRVISLLTFSLKDCIGLCLRSFVPV